MSTLGKNIFSIFIMILVVIILFLTVYFQFDEKKREPHTKMEKIHMELRTLMEDTKKLFQRFNITYFAIGGTLLGAIREKDIIPHDDDIDLAVFSKEMNILLSQEFKKALKEMQMKIYRCPSNAGHFKIQFTKSKVFIDIFPYEEIDEIVQMVSKKGRSYWKNGFFMKSEMYPLQQYKWGNTTIIGPRNPVPYFIRHFGKTWTTPIKTHNHL